jgi:hypothetical protein
MPFEQPQFLKTNRSDLICTRNKITSASILSQIQSSTFFGKIQLQMTKSFKNQSIRKL